MNTRRTAVASELADHLAGRAHAARRRYRKRLARCRNKFSENAVHELRVETRRLLALLDLLRALRLIPPPKKLTKAFKKRLDCFDDLRDTHVHLALLKPMWKHFPEARPLKKLLRRTEEKLVDRLARRIQETKHARINRRLKEIEQRLRRCLTQSPHQGAERLAVAALNSTFQRVALLRRQVRRADPRTIHRMRVAFKRLRYMSELLQPFVPGLTSKQLERMKHYQDAAGDIQDLTVLLRRLDDLVRDQELEPDALHRLRAGLSRRRDRAISSFMSRIDDLFAFQKSL